MKILIVDDSKPMRTLLGYFARELGFTAVEAEDGCYALDALRQQPDIGLALVDWEMPRMDGLEFVKAVRADRAFVELKLMMVTNQNSLERVAAALTAGAADFLMKPVSRDSFEAKLRLLGVVP